MVRGFKKKIDINLPIFSAKNPPWRAPVMLPRAIILAKNNYYINYSHLQINQIYL